MAQYDIGISKVFNTKISADNLIDAEIKAKQTILTKLDQLRELSYTYSEPNEELLDSLRTITRGVSF